MSDKMFEQAVRMKLRFPYKGVCTVEDLWDLNLTNLDGLYKTLRIRQKGSEEESLLKTKTVEDEVLSLQIELVKYVVETKQAEAAAKRDDTARRAEKKRLSEILASKQEKALENLSEEELRKRIEALS